jgi:NADH:ubiquinone oxidoreductase subunit 5 (subunit L)/multisubunit Na+/H+ antiporter MnhA subunit
MFVAVLAAILLVVRGMTSSRLLEVGGIGISVGLDAVSNTILLLVSVLGWVLVRFARTYPDGEARLRWLGLFVQPRGFFKRIAAPVHAAASSG